MLQQLPFKSIYFISLTSNSTLTEGQTEGIWIWDDKELQNLDMCHSIAQKIQLVHLVVIFPSLQMEAGTQ